MILDRVNVPSDLSKLSVGELEMLADEMRELIIKKVNTIGGHMGPNLGIVEATIALHRVFNSPVDKFIFDVSHQCYPHKIITGRKEGFLNSDNYMKYTGYTAPEESEHDLFKVGHTSTSLSLATGVAKARDLKGESYNVVALIGDGSLSGGEAFEGLDNASDLNSNIIIVVNDNDMSIAENHGGLYKNLKLLRETNGQAECNFFKSLGFEYLYVEEGNNIEKLMQTFERVKNTSKPTVVHIKTLKGKGLSFAEQKKEKYHWIMPGTLDKNGKETAPVKYEECYENITNDFILEKAKTDKTIMAITAGTPGAVMFDKDFREKLGQQYMDVGIAEEHAIACISAMAKSGARPIFAVLSSFIQRTYDQLSQDLCLNNSPAILLVHWGGLSGADATHLGSFDIPLISNIPNMVYLAPANKEEYQAMLEWAYIQKEHPVAIRVPMARLTSTGTPDTTDYSILNKFKVEEEGEQVAIFAVGNFFELGQKVRNTLKEKMGISATLVNPRFLTGLDEELLNKLKSNHKLVITLENGCLSGGFGEKIASFYGGSDVKVLNFGGEKEFTDREPIESILKRNHLTVEQIVDDTLACADIIANV